MRFGIRELIFIAVLLAIPAASWFYVFKPRNSDITRLRAENEVKQGRLDTLEEMASRIDDIGAEIEKGREAIRLVEAKLPPEQQVDSILEQSWQLADRNDLSLRSVKSREPVPASMYMEQPLEVVMEGDFNGFYQFLLEMEALPRITRIHEMELTRLDHKDSPDRKRLAPGSMRAEFTLSIYFEPQGMDH